MGRRSAGHDEERGQPGAQGRGRPSFGCRGKSQRFLVSGLVQIGRGVSVPSGDAIKLDAFDVLVGLRLSIIRRAADMLVLHFGDIRAHPSGEGTIGAYALHVQCPWRLDGPNGTVTGRDDLWVYAGPGERPQNWSYEDGWSLQDKRFASLFIRDERTRSWVNESNRFVVIATRQTKRGDVSLELANEHALLVFPAGSKYEAWRFFSPGSARHLIFPTTARD
jgi:hypothetical protein